MSEQYRVTSVGITPAEDRAKRMRTYFLVMSIRVLCIVSLFWVRGWWLLLVGFGAVVLPYFAVLIANAVDHGRDGERPDAPTPLELGSGEQASAADVSDRVRDTSDLAETVIVVDVDEHRRSSGDDS